MDRGKIESKKLPWKMEAGDVDKFNGRILGREHIFTGQHRMYVSAYEKAKDKFLMIDKSGPIPNSGKYYRQHLKIGKPQHLKHVMRAFAALSGLLGWKIGQANVGIAEIITKIKESPGNPRKVNKLRQIAAGRLQKNKKLKEEFQEFRSQMAEVMELYRQSHLPKFRKSLQAFKALVKQKKNEGQYQKFLADNDHMWILGLEYVTVNRHDRAGTEGIPDFVPQRFDGFHDVVEFKKPTDEVLVYKGKHWRQSTALKDGISQLMDYLELFDRNPRGSDSVTATADKYRPNGILLIGDMQNEPREKRQELRVALRKHNSFLQRIRVMTYDELINQAESVLVNLERSKKNPVVI